MAQKRKNLDTLFQEVISSVKILSYTTEVISVSHDEKVDIEWDKDTPKKGIKRWVFVILIDQSGYGYHKKTEVLPRGSAKTAEKLRIWADSHLKPRAE